MAIYESNVRSVAEYIDNMKIFVNPSNVIDDEKIEGYRIKEDGAKYNIKMHGIECNRIEIGSNCFINGDTITVESYIPSFKYRIVTEELHPAYQRANGNEHLKFEYKQYATTIIYPIVMKYWEEEIAETGYNALHEILERYIDNVCNYISVLILDGCTEFESRCGHNDWVLSKDFINSYKRVGLDFSYNVEITNI